jgi:hypothetical protein
MEANAMAIRNGLFAATAAAAALLLGSAAKPSCCFTNPQYSGVCAVEPGEGETCATILDYLNNPQSQGKTYCGNTSIRGGWKQVECKKASPPAASSPVVDRSVEPPAHR